MSAPTRYPLGKRDSLICLLVTLVCVVLLGVSVGAEWQRVLWGVGASLGVLTLYLRASV